VITAETTVFRLTRKGMPRLSLAFAGPTSVLSQINHILQAMMIADVSTFIAFVSPSWPALASRLGAVPLIK